MDGVKFGSVAGEGSLRVLMLGWEFPPVISGGLGTACYWLTKSLGGQGVRVTFVLPTASDAQDAGAVRVLATGFDVGDGMVRDAGGGLSIREVPSMLTSPYPGGQGVGVRDVSGLAMEDRPIGVLGSGPSGGVVGAVQGGRAAADRYGGDLLGEVGRFANACVRIAASERFDVIHAHDWVTFPAGLAVAAASGCPLIAHVHSTEYDRAGRGSSRQVVEIERRGVQGAARVIAVSRLTKSMVVGRYGVPQEKVRVVYNGIDTTSAVGGGEEAGKFDEGDKIVLFLGRITMQKGPEYFVDAAKKVLERYEGVKFVMAGSGDRVGEVIELAAARGIGHKVLFTGFLSGEDVQRVMRMADLFVMPSVSEPFGIAPLEAIQQGVPVIISKTSGVSEVLANALKVDFWDTDEIANKILAVLRHPPLGATLREQADLEIRGLTWDGAADKCRDVYDEALSEVAV